MVSRNAHSLLDASIIRTDCVRVKLRANKSLLGGIGGLRRRIRDSEVDTEDKASQQRRDEHREPLVLKRPVLEPVLLPLLYPDIGQLLELPLFDTDVAPLVRDAEQARPR